MPSENLPTITIEGGRIVAQTAVSNNPPLRPGVMESVTVSLPMLQGTYALVRVADGQTPIAEEVDWCGVHNSSKTVRGNRCDWGHGFAIGSLPDAAPNECGLFVRVLVVRGVSVSGEKEQ